LIHRELGSPPEYVGLLSSYYGTGALIGALLLPLMKRLVGRERLVVLGGLLIGIQMSAYARIGVFGMTMPLQVMSGIGFTVLGSTVRASLQAHLPKDSMARTWGALACVSGLTGLGSMKLGGVVADVFGVRRVFLLASCLTLASSAVLCLLLRVSLLSRQEVDLRSAASDPA